VVVSGRARTRARGRNRRYVDSTNSSSSRF
jgi:hypothetical protein